MTYIIRALKYSRTITYANITSKLSKLMIKILKEIVYRLFKSTSFNKLKLIKKPKLI